jgi:hypothetical protein
LSEGLALLLQHCAKVSAQTFFEDALAANRVFIEQRPKGRYIEWKFGSALPEE